MSIPNEAFYRVSVKAIIENSDHKILFVEEHDGRWELPGGGLKYGENIEQTLRRELLEELGIEISNINKRPLYYWTQKREKNGIEYYCFFLGFSTRISSNEFTFVTDEAVSAQYMSLDELTSFPLHPNLENFIALLKE